MTKNDNANLKKYFGSLDNIPADRKDEFIASVNRNCYIGAVNFIITLILRYKPHARIIFISNYEYNNGKNVNYNELINAQNTLSEQWAFPLCEVYKYLGFSNHIIPNTKEWFNETYSNNTDTDVTCFDVYNPDSVHPHSDITGTSNNIYAGIISQYIKNIR